MRRKRKHIPIIEIAAAFAAGEIERVGEEVAGLRAMEARRAPAREVLRLFTPDHITLHAWGGEDRWWNLHMRRRGPELKAKDAADTSRAAKAKRIDEKWDKFYRAMAKGRKPSPTKSKWKSRPFPKRRIKWKGKSTEPVTSRHGLAARGTMNPTRSSGPTK